ncbi:hypothetical protein DFJ74DRAFT_666603 [Hyaloraphidium curvatum]|nr:hypothetical protein DFJ74DRAFT_666603 [Hyaloraphidium curvatum]
MPVVLSTPAKLATVPIGLVVARQLAQAIAYYIAAIAQVPKTDARLQVNYRTGIAALDWFFQFVVPFFRFSLAEPAARTFLSALGGLLTPFLFYPAFEGLKPGGNALHLLYPAMGLGMQLFGVGFVTPLVWVPMMLSYPPTGALPADARTTLGAAVLFLGQALNVWVTANMGARGDRGTKFVAWFQVAPALAWLLWSFVPYLPEASPILGSLPAAPKDLAKNVYRLAAILAFPSHARLVLSFLRKPARIREALAVFDSTVAKSSPGKAAASFFAWDFVGLASTLGWLAAARNGFDTGRVGWFLTKAVLLGPGTALGMEMASWEA